MGLPVAPVGEPAQSVDGTSCHAANRHPPQGYQRHVSFPTASRCRLDGARPFQGFQIQVPTPLSARGSCRASGTRCQARQGFPAGLCPPVGFLLCNCIPAFPRGEESPDPPCTDGASDGFGSRRDVRQARPGGMARAKAIKQEFVSGASGLPPGGPSGGNPAELCGSVGESAKLG